MEYNITKGDIPDYPEVTELWEASVRATHHFLPQEEIMRIRGLMAREYLPSVDLFTLRDDDGILSAFLGMTANKIEMLFVHPSVFGRGLGRLLVRYAIDELGADSLDVNEQNPGALAFYRKMGFEVVSRDETDSSGAPYPILHMELMSRS